MSYLIINHLCIAMINLVIYHPVDSLYSTMLFVRVKQLNELKAIRVRYNHKYIKYVSESISSLNFISRKKKTYLQ